MIGEILATFMQSSSSSIHIKATVPAICTVFEVGERHVDHACNAPYGLDIEFGENKTSEQVGVGEDSITVNSKGFARYQSREPFRDRRNTDTPFRSLSAFTD